MAGFDDIVLFCDNHLLVVCKPAGMPSQADRSGDADLLSDARAYLKKRFDKPGRVFLGLVHRLDRPVSGVMVFARTSKAAARLSGQFRRREVEKRYVALVEGCMGDAGRVSGFLKKREGRIRVASDEEEGSFYAELSWARIAEVESGSVLDIRLVTGRKHQIRSQLASLGHPIVGDLRYGAVSSFDGRNLALHCYSLAVDHPTQPKRVSWHAKPPSTWGKAGDLVAEWMSSGWHPI